MKKLAIGVTVLTALTAALAAYGAREDIKERLEKEQNRLRDTAKK